MDDKTKRITELEAQLAEAQAGWAAAEDRITIEAECCNQLRHDLANAQVAAEGARRAMEEVKRLRGERDRYKAVYLAAKGLTTGGDWNNGTHAKIYRPQLINAVDALMYAVLSAEAVGHERGTGFAAPQVAGMAALAMGQRIACEECNGNRDVGEWSHDGQWEGEPCTVCTTTPPPTA